MSGSSSTDGKYLIVICYKAARHPSPFSLYWSPRKSTHGNTNIRWVLYQQSLLIPHDIIHHSGTRVAEQCHLNIQHTLWLVLLSFQPWTGANTNKAHFPIISTTFAFAVTHHVQCGNHQWYVVNCSPPVTSPIAQILSALVCNRLSATIAPRARLLRYRHFLDVTKRWWQPEAINSASTASWACSLCTCTYFMVTGFAPHGREDNIDMIAKIVAILSAISRSSRRQNSELLLKWLP